MLKRILLFTAVLLLALVGSASADLVTNGGFENGDFTGWIQTSATTGSYFGVDGSNPHTGAYDAYFGATGPYSDAISQAISTILGQSYTISFWLANVSVDPSNSFQAQWGGTSIQTLSDQDAFGYTEYTFTEQATASSELLSFLAWNNTGIFYLDDVSVNGSSAPGTSTPEPATMLLFGVGFAGVGLYRRMRSKFIN